MPNEHREFCRRQHRQLAAYLLYFTWRAGADFVVVQRSFLEKWLSLERFKHAREEWFLSDVEPWFPCYKRIRYGQNAFHSFFLSRHEFHDFPNGTMSDEERVALLRQQKVIGILTSQIAERPLKRASHYAREAIAVRELSDVSAGLSDLHHFRLKRRK